MLPVLFFMSCQKELSGEGGAILPPPVVGPDLTTRITSSITGFVTNENDAVVEGATVKAGTITATTDKYGYFEIKSAQVVKNAAVVTVTKPGYFNGIKTYVATENKGAFFRIKLLPKTNGGTVDAASGGTVTLSNGLAVTLPANGVVNAVTNAAYTGQVNIAAQWLNPVAADLGKTMPGDLRGLDNSGALKLLTTYGMSAVELTGAGGELLQVAPGKKATLNFPLPATVAGAAPATIPLWYFDEAKGLWKEEGSAVKSGSNYTGEVSHFSYWNCDVPLKDFVTFDLTLKDATGKSIAGASVSVKYANGIYTGAHGATDSSGYVKGNIPANTQLIIEVYTDYQCNGPVYTKDITTTNAPLSLGTVTLGANNTATISGNVTDCNSAAVTEGYVIAKIGGDYNYYRAAVNADGSFSLSTIICGGSTAQATIIAVDIATQQQSNPLTKTLTAGNNTVGILNACGITVEQFINYSVNGTSYAIVPSGSGSDSLQQYSNPNSTPPTISIGGYSMSGGSFKSANLTFTANSIAANSVQSLTSFLSSAFPDSSNVTVETPINVTITEYGAVGEFIAGNFTGTLTGPAPANTPYNVTCSFRVRREQ
ncbi:MAG: hypothetical protein QM791_22755 [Ferruginibacter sp.]